MLKIKRQESTKMWLGQVRPHWEGAIWLAAWKCCGSTCLIICRTSFQVTGRTEKSGMTGWVSCVCRKARRLMWPEPIREGGSCRSWGARGRTGNQDWVLAWVKWGDYRFQAGQWHDLSGNETSGYCPGQEETVGKHAWRKEGSCVVWWLRRWAPSGCGEVDSDNTLKIESVGFANGADSGWGEDGRPEK